MQNNDNHTKAAPRRAKEDPYQGHDYYNIDELLDEDHLLARDAVREWVKQEVSPIIEDYTERAECPKHLFFLRCDVLFGFLEVSVNLVVSFFLLVPEIVLSILFSLKFLLHGGQFAS